MGDITVTVKNEDILSVFNALFRIAFFSSFVIFWIGGKDRSHCTGSEVAQIDLSKRCAGNAAISSACPVVLRLINLRFPSLADHIIHMLPPMEVAARLAKERALKEHPELKPEEIGVCFISPCPAKASYVKNGFASYKSYVDEVVSISDIYFLLIGKMRKDSEIRPLSQSGRIGLGWARSGGEATAILNEDYLAADGIVNVIHVLDQIENDNIPPLEFIELNACTGGCVGGVLTIQNPFIAKARLQSLRRYLPVSHNTIDRGADSVPDSYLFDEMPQYHPISRLSESMSESMHMMSEIQKLKEILPGIDCGSCGAPTCRAFAEDIVKGSSCIDGCPIKFISDLKKAGEK